MAVNQAFFIWLHQKSSLKFSTFKMSFLIQNVRKYVIRKTQPLQEVAPSVQSTYTGTNPALSETQIPYNWTKSQCTADYGMKRKI